MLTHINLATLKELVIIKFAKWLEVIYQKELTDDGQYHDGVTW